MEVMPEGCRTHPCCKASINRTPTVAKVEAAVLRLSPMFLRRCLRSPLLPERFLQRANSEHLVCHRQHQLPELNPKELVSVSPTHEAT